MRTEIPSIRSAQRQVIATNMLSKAALLALLWLLWAAAGVFGQVQELDIDELAKSAEQWARENLDEKALASLQGADREQVERIFRELRKEFQGEYVIDLAAIRASVNAILPLLEEHEDTLPYALWLKTRLDYLEVADELRLIVKPPAVEPGQPPKPPPNPSAKVEREIWIKKVAKRPWPAAAKPLVPILKPIFQAESVPPELVWIAEVESSFDPRARSPEGAAGLFQLMPVAAKHYGLKTFPLDQRLKPEPSARAAAKMLRDLHKEFRDWRLAVAAYNAGGPRVRKLLALRKGSTYETIATRLPAETQLYVPKVEAIVLRREGVKLASLPAPTKR